MTKMTVVLAIVLGGFNLAAAEVYRECRINNGSPSSSCGSRYNGKAVIAK